MTLAESLQAHALPDHVLPYAPRRPFAAFSLRALHAAAELSIRWPEKRGILSHVVAGYRRQPVPAAAECATIEAHFDSVAIPDELGDRLLTLGFEPDGFARFVPAHFATHHTLKFKVEPGNPSRGSELRREVERRCRTLAADLAEKWPDTEAYIELEIYASHCRRRWPAPGLAPDWAAHAPLAAGALQTVLPPCTAAQARHAGLPITIAKRADIHAKIAAAAAAGQREALLDYMQSIGFYRVLTWAGNDICTAQFARGDDARACYDAVGKFFDAQGGCSELTLESVMWIWRSALASGDGSRLAALPPLVVSARIE